MPDIVAIARRLRFDGVKFQMIRNWNTYGDAEFTRHNIGSPAHPEYAAFLEALRDPHLAAADIEFWGMPEASLAASRELTPPSQPGSLSAVRAI